MTQLPDSPVALHRYLLIADGTPVSNETLARLSADNFERGKILALDGAANHLRSIKQIPDAVLGDFDSITPETRAAFEDAGVAFIHTPRQDATDLEKAILYCREQGATSIHIASALGVRTDHTLGNLSFLKKYHTVDCPLALYTDTEKIEFIRNATLSVRGVAGERFAVLGFTSCTVSSSGLEYEMHRHRLELGVSESLSNALTTGDATLLIEGDALVITSGAQTHYSIQR